MEAALADPNNCVHLVGNGHFSVGGSASVKASGSASVRAWDSASVKASGSASVEASGSASVRAWGSASVRAWGSASVKAWGSASVEASGSASVEAWGSASVRASKYVAVTVHGVRTKVEGGVVIQIPEITTAEEWCEFYGVEVNDGIAVLYKATDKDFLTHGGLQPFSYEPGSTPGAPDWDEGRAECGGGLHFSPRPFIALRFAGSAFDNRFVACPVRVSEIVVHKNAQYPDKVKAPGCAGPVYEVDIDGNRIEEEEVA